MPDFRTPARPDWWEAKDWFKLDDYRGFDDLGAGGWAAVLGEIHQLLIQGRERNASEWFDLDAPPETWGPWDDNRDEWWEVRRAGWLAARASGRVRAAYEDDRPIEELVVGPGDVIREAGPWVLHAESYPVIKVDLNTPDAVLVKAFKAWLAERRRERPLAIVRRGPRTSLGPAIRAQMDRWARYRIVAVFDLDFWATLRNSDPDPANHVEVDKNQGNLPTKVVAERVFRDLLPPSYSDPERARHVSEARGVLQEALLMYPSLALQANSEIR